MITSNVVSASVIGGELLIGLADGSIIRAGMVQGARGLKGDPGPPGPKGEDGRDGERIWSGQGPPRPELGTDGDFYVQQDSLAWWGPKSSGRWVGPPIFLLSEAARRDRIGGPMQRRGEGRSAAAFFGGVGTGTANQAQPQQGLLPIIGNGQPLPSNRDFTIADSSTGTIFDVKLRCESATGIWAGTVNVANFNTIADHDVYGEINIGPNPPVITFTPSVNGTKLELAVSSDQALVKIEGVIIEIS